jgi:hypothetical protein
MTYKEKLRDPRWQRKRLEILNRDDFKCRLCGLGVDPLHVHHKYYDSGKEPWDYDERALMTLCESCHDFETENSKTAIPNLSASLKRSGFMMCDVNRLSSSIERIDYEIILEVHMTAICYALSNKYIMDELVKMMLNDATWSYEK